MTIRLRHSAVALTFVLLVAGTGSVTAEKRPVTIYRSLCDASAGVALDDKHFAVADDELPSIEIFRRGEPKAVDSVPLRRFLAVPKGGEADLEGGARVGDRIYWISSHGRDSDAIFHASRLRFFATEIGGGRPPKLTPIEHFYPNLLADLSSEPKLANYNLAAASRLAPEAEGGLGIEGLTTTPEGGLMIGFRNPIRAGKALLVPLVNPEGLLKGEKARFGDPIDLDLDGRGIRSVERVGDSYWIVAGPPGKRRRDDENAFVLCRWSGPPKVACAQVPLDLANDFSPESIFTWPDGTLQILSDDGDVRIDGTKCKNLEGQDADKKRFRSIDLAP